MWNPALCMGLDWNFGLSWTVQKEQGKPHAQKGILFSVECWTCFSLCIVFVWLLISVQTRLCIRRAPRLIELKLKIYPGVSCIKIVLLQVLKGLSYLRENHSIIHRGRYYNHGKLLLVQNCMFHPEGNILLLMSAVVYIYLII